MRTEMSPNNTTLNPTFVVPSTTKTEPSNPPNQIPNADLRQESKRLETFTSAWIHTHLDPKLMALTGFYYLGTSDNVKCLFCKVEIGRWEPTDQELSEHLRWSPNCPLLRRRHTDNVPIDADALDRVLPPLTYDVCGSGVEIRENTVSEGTFNTVRPLHLPITVMSSLGRPSDFSPNPTTDCTPKFPEYAIESARLRSFEDWPKTLKQKPQALSDAGLFYTTKGDRVKCFSCGGGLRDWDEDDVPWEQHAKWFGHCEYVQLVKGQEYVNQILMKDSIRQNELAANTVLSVENNHAPAIEPLNYEPTNERKYCESKLCKICYTCEYNTTFTPCGHVAACAKCALSVSQCPICRQQVEKVIRLFFS